MAENCAVTVPHADVKPAKSGKDKWVFLNIVLRFDLKRPPPLKVVVVIENGHGNQ